ncbi:hypothetical protein B0J17DRAFT_713073 [Rhizoctonia solani]|nr:hypothetical protein B0J17DRAFT_713073 [Rhizoctonia solani]
MASDVWTSVYELLIWDWRSGALLHRIGSQEGFCDFTFLDRQHFAVLSVTRPSSAPESLAILVYATSNDASTLHASPDTKSRINDYPISRPLLCFEFPRFNESSGLAINEETLFLRSDPSSIRSYTRS